MTIVRVWGKVSPMVFKTFGATIPDKWPENLGPTQSEDVDIDIPSPKVETKTIVVEKKEIQHFGLNEQAVLTSLKDWLDGIDFPQKP